MNIANKSVACGALLVAIVFASPASAGDCKDHVHQAHSAKHFVKAIAMTVARTKWRAQALGHDGLQWAAIVFSCGRKEWCNKQGARWRCYVRARPGRP